MGNGGKGGYPTSDLSFHSPPLGTTPAFEKSRGSNTAHPNDRLNLALENSVEPPSSKLPMTQRESYVNSSGGNGNNPQMSKAALAANALLN